MSEEFGSAKSASSISESAASSSAVELGLPCNYCTDNEAPARVRLTVPQVQHDYGGGNVLTLNAGTYELSQSANYPCCYEIKISDATETMEETWLTANVGSIALAAQWSTLKCGGGSVFWRAYWSVSVSYPHACMNLSATLVGNSSFGVTPNPPGNAQLVT